MTTRMMIWGTTIPEGAQVPGTDTYAGSTRPNPRIWDCGTGLQDLTEPGCSRSSPPEQVDGYPDVRVPRPRSDLSGVSGGTVIGPSRRMSDPTVHLVVAGIGLVWNLPEAFCHRLGSLLMIYSQASTVPRNTVSTPLSSDISIFISI